jgi:DNA anti-recombination protein RmuC
MTDHLLLGILIGMASGIAALIVVSAVTLHRFEAARAEGARVHRALADLHASWERGELAGRQTDILAERLGQLTEPVLGALRAHPMSALSAMAEAQERRFSAVTAELKGLGDVVDARLDDVCTRLDEQVRQMQIETRERLDHLRSETLGHAKDLQNDVLESLRAHAEQVRIAVDERLQGTLTRRLGENLGGGGDRLERVSDRLEQVHRGLVEVHTFATGVGDRRRALANTRRGRTKTRPDPAAGGEEGGKTD